jgi:UDP-N-acetylmuramoylalanine-D-glutamate ligase
MYEGEEDEWGGLEVYPADWKLHGKSAGHIRNQQMLDESKPDIVIAFPGGRGTANMIKRAKKAGVEVFQVDT